MTNQEEPLGIQWLEVTAELDRGAVEVLQLEIRRLAARCGLDLRHIGITKLTKSPNAVH